MTTATLDPTEQPKDADARDSAHGLFGKFFVNGEWRTVQKTCSTCCYVRHFDKRPDEPSNMGCTKPGWEGYTHADEMACGGCFYFPNNAISETHETCKTP
jgi:hypothetical protein